MAFPIEKFIEELRLSVLDDPEQNDLLMDYEFQEKNIELALRRVIGRINSTPPIFSHKMTLESFSDHDNYLTLFPGVLAYLYQGRALQEKRNELQYTDEGQSVNEDHRYGDYMNVANMLFGEFDEKISNSKRMMNEEIGFERVPSETMFFRYWY